MPCPQSSSALSIPSKTKTSSPTGPEPQILLGPARSLQGNRQTLLQTVQSRLDHEARLAQNQGHVAKEKEDTEGFGNSHYKGEPCVTPLNQASPFPASAMATLTFHTHRPLGSFSQPRVTTTSNLDVIAKSSCCSAQLLPHCCYFRNGFWGAWCESRGH